MPVEYLLGASCLLPAYAELRPGKPERMVAPELSPAEQAVLRLIQAGCANKEIAALLGKAQPTVKHQVSSILRKTGTRSRCELLALILRSA